MRSFPVRCLILAALLLAIPATGARAATFTPTNGTELQAALTAAAATGSETEPDEVVLDGAAIYNRSGGFTYSAPSTAKLRITGNGATVSASDTGPAVMIFDGGAIDISALKVQATLGFDTGITTQYSGTTATLDGVSVSGSTSGNGNSAGLSLGGGSVTGTNLVSTALASQGITLAGTTSTLTGADVSGATARQIYVPYGAADIADVDVHDPGALYASAIEGGSPTAVVTVRRARIADSPGVAASMGAQVTVTDSLFLIPPLSSIHALRVGDQANSAAFSSTIDAQRVTIVGTGDSSQRAAVVGDGSTNEADHHSITLSDSIVADIPIPLSCSEPGGAALPANTLFVNRTSLPAGYGVNNSCGDGIADLGILLSGVTTLEPIFVNPAIGDYRPLRTSPLIDLGATTEPLVGSDLGGGLRFVNGAVDLGAYEYQRTPPAVTAKSTPGDPVAGQPAALKATGADADPGETAELTYAWTFSDGTTATGDAPLHVFPLIGPASATVTATDPTGEQTSTTIQLNVVAPPPGSLDRPTGATGTPAEDTTVPRLTGLKVTKKIRRGAKLPTAVTGGGQVRFTLSETATVAVRFERLKGRRATRVPGSFKLRLAAGARALRFTGRISKSLKLKPGTYRIVLTPTDPTGNTGGDVRATFTLR